MSANFAVSTIEWGATPNTLTLLDLMYKLTGETIGTMDDDYSMYLQMAGEACEKYIDNKLALQSVTEQYKRMIAPVPLRFWPVPSIDAVTLDGEDKTADWNLYWQDGIPWITTTNTSYVMGNLFEQLDVSYQAGYEPLPTEVGYAIVRTAMAYNQNAGGVSGAVKKESIVGVGSVEYSTPADESGNVGLLSATTLGALEQYRRYNA